MNSLVQDIRFGLRMLRRSPGFTTVGVLTLALGIGANVAVFTVVNAVIVQPLRFPDAQSLMVILSATLDGKKSFQSAPGVYLDWRDRTTTFDPVAGARSTEMILSGGDQPHSVSVVAASHDFLTLIGARPILGRGFTKDEDQPGHDTVALLSAGLWRREFGGKPDILGQTIILNDKRYDVIGILASDIRFGYFGATDVWMPIAARRDARSGGDVVAAGRLKPGVTADAARSEMSAIMEQIRREQPQDSQTGVVVKPLQDWVVGDSRSTFLMLLGAVGFVLLICCANIANLLLARASVRRKEMAIRAVLGAGRFRLVRQALVESSLLAAAGGAAGVLLAFAAIRAVPAIRAIYIPRLEEIAVDRTVLAFAAGVTAMSGLLFGLAPAFRLRRDPGPALRGDEASSIGGWAGFRLRNILVVAQVALALVLLSGAGLMANSLLRLLNIDLGFKKDHVLTVGVSLPYKRYDPGQSAEFMRRLAAELSRMPGFQKTSASDYAPLQAVLFPYNVRTDSAGEVRTCEAQARHVDVGYLGVMGIPLLAGRDLQPRDDTRQPVPVLINQTMARIVFSQDDPIGKHLTTQYRSRKSIEVVGVVGDVRQLGLTKDPGPQMYLPLGYGNAHYVVARTSSNAADPAAIRNAVRALDPSVPEPRVTAMDTRFSQEVAKPRFYLALIGAFAAVGLALAAIGIFGVMAYTVTRRTPEFGIRMALGAEPRDIRRLVLGAGARLACVGAVLGLSGSYATSQLLSSLLYGVKPGDPLTFGCVLALLVGISLLACYMAARRATALDPSTALRSE